MNNIEKLIINCIEISSLESNKYAKLITVCNDPEHINDLRKIHITKEKHCNMLLECYKNIVKKEPSYEKKEYQLIGDFKNNIRKSFKNCIKNIDIYRELYFLFNDYNLEKDLLFEIILDEQLICTENCYMMNS